MKIKKAEYIKSSPNLKSAYVHSLPEIALIGRSNVGKSSFINCLCNRKNLAKTSNTPGKTRLLNFYLINEEFVITDMPGYGYAKVSKTEQARWQKDFEEYLTQREQLKFVFHLVDSRYEIQKNDIQMHQWLEYSSIPSIVVANKSEGVKKNELASYIKLIKLEMNSEPIIFSAKTAQGKDEVLARIQGIL
jgi:GTP-binding protein